MSFSSAVTPNGRLELTAEVDKRHLMVDSELRAQKRALVDNSPDEKLALVNGQQQCKVRKISPSKEDTPSESTRAGSSPSSSADVSPGQSDEEAIVPKVLDFRSAVERAMDIYKEEWITFAIKRDTCRHREDPWKDASELTEARVAEKYEEMKAAVMGLLPHLGTMQPASEGNVNYDVLEFQGRKPPPLDSRIKDASEEDEEALVKKMGYEWLRRESQGAAWEALCAIISILSSRKEKPWLEAEVLGECIEDLLKNVKEPQREGEIRKILDREVKFGCGYFAHFLINPNSTLRVAFKQGVPSPFPASLVITTRLTLWDAIMSEDCPDDCPMIGEAKTRKWLMAAGRQFAFQEANFGVYEGTEEDKPPDRNYRKSGATLQPDPKLGALLRSKRKCVMLEVLASLSSRELSKNLGLSALIKIELARVTREAKSRGEAVMLVLGSDAPHLLAEKVYMKSPCSDYGLRTGYLRWRESADVPWARERDWSSRACLCLQMP